MKQATTILIALLLFSCSAQKRQYRKQKRAIAKIERIALRAGFPWWVVVLVLAVLVLGWVFKNM